jgi:hypothetical protein
VTFDCVGDDFFRAAFAVHLRGVDQRHPEINSQTQRRDFLRVCALVLAHSPCALTKHRNARAIRQLHCLHTVSIESGSQESRKDFARLGVGVICGYG